MPIIIETERLILRTWQESDMQMFYEMNQDPRVIKFLRGPLTMHEAQTFYERMVYQYKERDYTLYAVEVKSGPKFIGFVGLNYTDFPGHFTPAVEIGWRLASGHWGKGYATEAARAVLKHGFETCKLSEIVSFTTPLNKGSVRVMQKIGLAHNAEDDFMHPKLATDHPLAQHVLYRLRREDY